MNLLTDLLESWHRTWREVRKRNVEAREKRAVAKAFNDRYCYRHHYVTGGYCWMCPECNKLHANKDYSALSGLQYPACCSYADGHRIGLGIRV